ncbi:hypothetical protein M422DRAFT_261651 [Sphaerobolus stellatus SS14]|uniref:Uncharacterized protein n=1 Tax=Sphaerobolus stellatus (strain SS14) TaxID=990650 RepID=A0A0C9UMM8_SPHS4|nr:hypothetical protein M422DRAFT_261651 [Sphaerobolus stellatus SS14]
MKNSNTWPDAATYTPLTLETANAAKPRLATAVPLISRIEAYDDDTSDSYMDLSLTSPHLVATLDAFGPNIADFPLSIRALLDISCPSTVINNELVDHLGLKRYPLPPEEDNLSSLSESPLSCKEYVKLRVRSGNGAWISGTFRVKVNVGLPVELILGMPFLSAHHLIIDTHARTAIDQHVGYDLISPPTPLPTTKEKPHVTPPPTPKKPKKARPLTFENAPPPTLAGYLLPQPIMAMVRDRIESLAYQELLAQKD